MTRRILSWRGTVRRGQQQEKEETKHKHSKKPAKSKRLSLYCQVAIESYQPKGFFDFSATRGGTAEFQLAALIVILELYKNEAPYNRQYIKPPRMPPTCPTIRTDRGLSVTVGHI